MCNFYLIYDMIKKYSFVLRLLSVYFISFYIKQLFSNQFYSTNINDLSDGFYIAFLKLKS